MRNLLHRLRNLLHRLGYEYKKPKLVPGNPDIDAQKAFIKYYEDFRYNKPFDAENGHFSAPLIHFLSVVTFRKNKTALSYLSFLKNTSSKLL